MAAALRSRMRWSSSLALSAPAGCGAAVSSLNVRATNSSATDVTSEHAISANPMGEGESGSAAKWTTAAATMPHALLNSKFSGSSRANTEPHAVAGACHQRRRAGEVGRASICALGQHGQRGEHDARARQPPAGVHREGVQRGRRARSVLRKEADRIEEDGEQQSRAQQRGLERDGRRRRLLRVVLLRAFHALPATPRRFPS